MVAHLLDTATGELRELPAPDPGLGDLLRYTWSPDGDRLACETFGVDDPTLTGIYAISTSDGGDLTRITSNPGGDDIPGDYSPDGSQMVFVRFEDDEPRRPLRDQRRRLGAAADSPPTGCSSTRDGFGGRSSPDGSQILVVARRGSGSTTRPSGSSTRTAANPSPWR